MRIVELDRAHIAIPETLIERLQRTMWFKRGWKRHIMMVGPLCGVWIRWKEAAWYI